MKSSKITAIILTLNEEHRLPLLFDNLSDFSEIIVFDGGSTDSTEKICASHGVKFVSRPLALRDTVGGDIRFVLEKVQTPYVLYVNCSHYYPIKLLEEFKHIAEAGRFSAVYHDIIVYTYGRVVHRPLLRRVSSATVFYRVDAVNFANSIVHNEAPVEVPNKLKYRLPASDEYAVHIFRDYNVRKAESNHSFYGDQDAQLRFVSGIRTSPWLIIWRPIKYFTFQYLRCGSIRCGTPGLIYSLLYAQLELNIQMKIWELQNNLLIDNIKELHIRHRSKMRHSQIGKDRLFRM